MPVAPSGEVDVAVDPGVGVTTAIGGAVRELEGWERLGFVVRSLFAVDVSVGVLIVEIYRVCINIFFRIIPIGFFYKIFISKIFFFWPKIF